MSMPNEPDERASSEENAESRAYRRIVHALKRDDIDELAAALLQQLDPPFCREEAEDPCAAEEADSRQSGLRKTSPSQSSRR